jgi:hypothetical protein
MTRKTILRDGTWSAEAGSLVDPVGRILHYEGRLLRGIRRAFAADVPTILDAAERDKWFDHGLVPTWVTDLSTEEFPLILEHQRIPFVTIRAEWPAEALRRAALCHLDLSAALARSGYCLKDAHTWNLLFDGPTPKITDFGSIRPLAELHLEAWLQEFHKYFLAPMFVFARGQGGLARAMLREHLAGVGLWLIDHAPEALLPDSPGAARLQGRDPLETFAGLTEIVQGLVFPHASSEWTGYAQPANTAAPDELRTKDRLVGSLLERLPFGTAIDLGANRGLHAWMCAAKGASVLACDIDETCLDDMFLRASRNRDAVLPLYLDVVLPGGATGAFGTIPPASERLRCDLVLALALVHHVCFRWQFTPEAFASGVAAFTRRAAIIEFIPADDWHVAQWGLPTPPGYSLAGMHDALGRVFDRVECIPSEPPPRHMFVCEGKR